MENEVTLIKGAMFADDRGFLRFVNDFNFEGVKRFYQVENYEKGFIRAWHGHMKEGKYVYVVKGSAIVGTHSMETDITQRFVLSASKPEILWIPPSHYNGFKTLEENTILMFFSTSTLEESKGDDIREKYNKWDIWNVEYR
jgi:dTDP-4-dehydrorhamnose 3,5-epimerase-like enzyme